MGEAAGLRRLSDLAEVIVDVVSRFWCLGGDISPQELAVAKGDSTGSMDTYDILVKLADLNDDACLVPLVGMWTCLALNTYVVANCKRW